MRLVNVDEGYKVAVVYNPEGNSVLFLTPILLAAILAMPWLVDKRERYVSAGLWMSVVAVLGLVLRLSGTGWHQVGYRYVLDVLMPWLLLVMVGIKGKLSPLVLVATGWSVFIWTVVVLQV